MIRITTNGALPNGENQARHYQLAGQAVVCQHELPALRAFGGERASSQFSQLLGNAPDHEILNAQNAELSYVGHAPFASVQREITLWRSSGRAQLDVDGVPSCQLDFSEEHIHIINGEPLDSDINLELVTGPALVLMLCQHNTYCMHAGAIETPAGRFAVSAESGAGKSTLSAHGGERWRQLSDDILPMAISDVDQEVALLPRFPQLKLPNSTVATPVQNGVSLGGVIRLNPKPRDNLLFIKLSKTDAMLQMIRHTVAAKLFDNETLSKHADFAKEVASRVPVIEMRYPRNINDLEQLRGAISDYMRGLLEDAL